MPLVLVVAETAVPLDVAAVEQELVVEELLAGLVVVLAVVGTPEPFVVQLVVQAVFVEHSPKTVVQVLVAEPLGSGSGFDNRLIAGLQVFAVGTTVLGLDLHYAHLTFEYR